MVEVTCIFCSVNAAKIAFEENGITGKQCLACNLIYPAIRPLYPDFFTRYIHTQPAPTELAADILKRLYAKHHLSIIKKYVQHGDLLEIGSGFGQLVDEARLKGLVPYAIEINHHKADYLATVIHVIHERRPLSYASFDGQQFDVIFHTQVLHEFYDPRREFEMIAAKVVKGGYTIFETTNTADIDSRFYPLLKPFGSPFTQFFLSDQNIKTLLQETGFELITTYRYSLLPQLRFLHFIERYFKISPFPQVASPHNINMLPWWERSKEKYKQLFLRYYFRWLTYLLYTVGERTAEPQAPQAVLYVARKI
jgi:SAM-dependent methyltransferase